MRQKTVILMVEDSPEDFEAAKRGLEKAGFAHHLAHCQDGDEALDYLLRRGPYEDPKTSPRPTIILLDLNLPGTDGREVLKTIKAEPELRKIPVLVLTTSSDERDIQACYEAGANTYVLKPVDLHGFMEAVGRLKNFWLEIALLPNS